MHRSLGFSALNFALILSGILLRLTPERAPRTVLRDERPENLGFYACMVTTNVGSFNFVIEFLSSSTPNLKSPSIRTPSLLKKSLSNSKYLYPFKRVSTPILRNLFTKDDGNFTAVLQNVSFMSLDDFPSCTNLKKFNSWSFFPTSESLSRTS
jgi:hypothetical protein